MSLIPSLMNGQGRLLPSLGFTFLGCVGDTVFEPWWGAVSWKVLSSIIWPDIFLGGFLMSVSLDQILWSKHIPVSFLESMALIASILGPEFGERAGVLRIQGVNVLLVLLFLARYSCPLWSIRLHFLPWWRRESQSAWNALGDLGYQPP